MDGIHINKTVDKRKQETVLFVRLNPKTLLIYVQHIWHISVQFPCLIISELSFFCYITESEDIAACAISPAALDILCQSIVLLYPMPCFYTRARDWALRRKAAVLFPVCYYVIRHMSCSADNRGCQVIQELLQSAACQRAGRVAFSSYLFLLLYVNGPARHRCTQNTQCTFTTTYILTHRNTLKPENDGFRVTDPTQVQIFSFLRSKTHLNL